MSGISQKSPEILKRDLAASTGSDLISYNRGLAGSINRKISSIQKETVSVFDYIPSNQHAAILNATSAYDCTADVNKALLDCKDFYTLFVPPGRFNVSNLITHPTTTFYGSGRHRTNFWCLPATIGKMISDVGNGAQKLDMRDMAFYGNNEIGLTHVGEFGNVGVQYGTEGLLKNLWFRDAPNAIALDVNANVGIISDISIINVFDGLVMAGNANMLQNIAVVAASNIGIQATSGFYKNIEIEAIGSGGVPLEINGNAHFDGLTLSLATLTNFASLININPTVGDIWTVDALEILGSGTFGSVFSQGLKTWSGVKGANVGQQFTKNLTVGASPDAVAIKGIFKKVAAIAFPSILPGSRQNINITVIGATPNMPVIIGFPSSGPYTNLYYEAWVSAKDTVTISAYNLVGAAITPPPSTFVFTVLDYA